MSAEPVLVSLGSNLGDRHAVLALAARRIGQLAGATVVAASRLFETLPWGGPPGQGTFINAALLLDVRDRSPRELLDHLLAIEAEAGRLRGVRNGPRTLDLDLLLFGRRCVREVDLVVPHPRMLDRAFVMIPAADAAPDLVHPLDGRSLGAIAAGLDATGVIGVVGSRDWAGRTRSLSS